MSVVEAAGDADFDPASALFVCNKWDQIPVGEQSIVSKHTFEKLSSLYPGITEKQLVYLSALQVCTSLLLMSLYMCVHLLIPL